MMLARLAAAIFAAALAAPAEATPPRLAWPVACSLGTTCFIEDYVDRDPGAGTEDYMCGLKTRDGHRGTDIVLPSFAAMARGVDVLAAAPGTVAATRDGVADVAVTPETREDVTGRECGNGLRIDHGAGWQTLYCHMERGSLSVAEGDRVAAGDRLGRVGLSGLTNVPHLHLGVLKDGAPVDPFLPRPAAACGAAPEDGLWRDPPGYDRAGLFTAGFSTAVPDFEAVKTGAARVRETAPGEALVLYGHVFHARPGDRLVFAARGPGGEIFAETVPLQDPQAQLFRATGRRSPPGGWPHGDYRGYVTLRRGDRIIAVRHADITVSD